MTKVDRIEKLTVQYRQGLMTYDEYLEMVRIILEGE